MPGRDPAQPACSYPKQSYNFTAYPGTSEAQKRGSLSRAVAGVTDNALLQGPLNCQLLVLQDSAKFLLITLLLCFPNLCLWTM